MKKDVQLYGPDGKTLISSSYSKMDVSNPEMQTYSDDTLLDIGALVEIRLREVNGNPRKSGCDTRLGYVIKDNEFGGPIVLSMSIPKKLLKQSKIAKYRITEFRVFPSTKCDYLPKYQVLEHAMIGLMVELFENLGNPLTTVKNTGYITHISTQGITISMNHPSNRYAYTSRNTEKFDENKIDRFRVLGHRKLW